MIRDYIKRCEGYSIVISILMIVLSIFLMINPLESLEAFVIMFSFIIILNGVAYFVSYFNMPKKDKLFSFDILMGLITLIAGILIFIYRANLINIFPIILGIWIIVSNLFKLQLSINISTVIDSGVFLIILSILMIILGILLIVNPFTSLITITMAAGICLLMTSIVDLIESIYVLIKLR
mgnify:CR=1 FL=1